MKLNTKINTVKTNSTAEVFRTKTAKRSSFITDLVISIYTNPEQAVIRELVANAIDEHVKYGVDRKVQLIIPTKANGKFLVRDFGKGLSHDEMIELFPTIGLSTKNDSERLIGGYGIGRFSLFSCADIAIISSYHNGEKSTYLWNKSKEGDIEIRRQSKTTSDEPSGLEISFHAKQKNVLPFKKGLDILKYVSDKIECNVEIPETAEEILSGDNFVLYKIKSWHVRPHEVTMGGIPYPLDSAYTPMHLERAGMWRLILPIGSLDLTNNRDQLRYTDRTKNKIKKTFEVVKARIKDLAQKDIDACNTPLEALQKSVDLNQLYDLDYVDFKGKRYDLYGKSDSDFHKRTTCVRNGETCLIRKVPCQKVYRLLDKRATIIDDIGKYSEKCIRHYIEENNIGRGYAFHIFPTEEMAKDVTLLDPAEFIICSEYNKKIPKNTTTSKPNPKTDIEKADVFKLKGGTDLTNCHSYVKSSLEVYDVKKTDTFHYLPIYRYEVSGIYQWARMGEHFDKPIYLLRENKIKDYPNAINARPILQTLEEKIKEKHRKEYVKFLTANSEEYARLKQLVDNGYKNDSVEKFVVALEKYYEKKSVYSSYQDIIKWQKENPAEKVLKTLDPLVLETYDIILSNKALKSLVSLLNSK